MISIKIIPDTTAHIIEFLKQEWDIANITHFGKPVEWKKEKQTLQAFENDKLVGVLELVMQTGVMHINEIIIKHTHQQQGIGKSLMRKAEEIARQNHMHKIYFETGTDWPARKFYESLGYEKTGDLPKHWVQHDFVIYTKFL